MKIGKNSMPLITLAVNLTCESKLEIGSEVWNVKKYATNHIILDIC